MNILNKIHINKLTYIILTLSVITGQFRVISLIAILLLFHGLGHIIVSKIFKWNISRIEIMPFGGNIKYDISLDEKINKELLVTIAGPLFQLIFTYILINTNILSYTETINIRNISYSLLLFNMLPIIPLDGSKLLFLLLNKISSYYKSHVILIYTSIIFLLLFIINSLYNLTFEFVIIFLIINILNEYKNHNTIINKFLLEKYLYKNKFNKLKILKKINPKSIWKNRVNLFVINKKIIHEKQILKNYFKR